MSHRRAEVRWGVIMAVESIAGTLSLDKLLRHALDGVFVVDRQRRYVVFNEGCERITGFRGEEIVGQVCQCGDVVKCRDDHGRPLWGFLCPATTLFESSALSARQRMQICRKDGAKLWVETVYTPVRDWSGRVEYVLGVIRDVSETKGTEDDLREEMSRLRKRAEGQGGNSEPEDLDGVLARVERECILRALKTADGQRNKAAEIMNISRSRLYRRMEALGIRPDAGA
ncbi:MAG TPA: PAS domain S-box protein [Phycisphaerae bacterium]|nr:PAS domain S-box protein [Phycisphaerae bacterium]